MSTLLTRDEPRGEAKQAGDDRFFLFFAYVCQSFYLQRVLSYRPNSWPEVWVSIDMAASHARPAFNASAFCCRGFTPEAAKVQAKFGKRGPEFTGSRVSAGTLTP